MVHFLKKHFICPRENRYRSPAPGSYIYRWIPPIIRIKNKLIVRVGLKIHAVLVITETPVPPSKFVFYIHVIQAMAATSLHSILLNFGLIQARVILYRTLVFCISSARSIRVTRISGLTIILHPRIIAYPILVSGSFLHIKHTLYVISRDFSGLKCELSAGPNTLWYGIIKIGNHIGKDIIGSRFSVNGKSSSFPVCSELFVSRRITLITKIQPKGIAIVRRISVTNRCPLHGSGMLQVSVLNAATEADIHTAFATNRPPGVDINYTG